MDTPNHTTNSPSGAALSKNSHEAIGSAGTGDEEQGHRPYDRIVSAAARDLTRPPCIELADVAKAAGVSLEEIHHYFSDGEVLAAVVIQGEIMKLTDYLVRRVSAAPPDDLVAQLRELINAYVEWFFDNPVGGRLLVSPPAMSLASKQEVIRNSASLYELSASMLERARDAGVINTSIDIPKVMLTMRALTLGVVVLNDLDHARPWGNLSDPQGELARVINSYFDLVTQ